jgi:hypothetical protein
MRRKTRALKTVHAMTTLTGLEINDKIKDAWVL